MESSTVVYTDAIALYKRLTLFNFDFIVKKKKSVNGEHQKSNNSMESVLLLIVSI